MLTQERQIVIRERLTQEGRVIASQLATEFQVSEDTIRRDLRDLAAQGLCERVYGGALLRAPDAGPIHQRKSEEHPDKRAVAGRAAQRVREGQVIFIDAGSTNVLLARALPVEMDMTVVTNAPLVADALSAHGRVQVILLGGVVDQRRGAALGAATLRAIEDIRADVFFIGTCGFDPEAGVTAFDPEEAEVKRAMARHSDRICVVATDDKIGTNAPFRVVKAEKVTDLISSRKVDPVLVAEFEQLGIHVDLL